MANEFDVTVKISPALRYIAQVNRVVTELLELVPAWCVVERDNLTSELERLTRELKNSLEVTPRIPKEN